MRTREDLVGDFNSLVMGVYDRMTAIAHQSTSPSALEEFDANATAIVDSLNSVQKRYFKLLKRLDGALTRASRQRPSNVLSFRPRPRNKR